MAENQNQEGRARVFEPGKTEMHPEGQLCLSDGTLLTAYKRSVPMERKTEEEQEQTKELFYRNAFLFLQHSKEILSDSRMFLAPVCVNNNLAYTGRSGLANPTLGVYIEWWHECEKAIQEADKKKWLVCHIAGSPLSGCNHCCMINEQGKKRNISFSPFMEIWSSFMKINQRYDGVKPLYEAYSLEEVVNILGIVNEKEPPQSIETFFLRQQCSLLKKLLDAEKKLTASLKQRLVTTTIALHEERAKALLEQYLTIKEQSETRNVELKELLKQWKAKLKRGEITNVEYQKTITPLKKELADLKYKVSSFLWDNREAFPEKVSIDEIIEYFDRKEKRG